MPGFVLPPMLSWAEFLEVATTPPSTPTGRSRNDDRTEWAHATWSEALRLARDGWPLALQAANVSVGHLRERAGLSGTVTVLEPTWDVTGSEVDIGAYLAGVPECMVDAVPRQVSRRGKVITFVIPTAYSNRTSHRAIINRGLALATLSAAIIEAGHSVEIWSGDAGMVDARTRFCAMIRVITAGEALDVGRLIFAVAHPAMCRRLAMAVWDAQEPGVAFAMQHANYGLPPYGCSAADLPVGITDPYVFPYLSDVDMQWDELETALAWCRQMFGDLGLIQQQVG